MKKTFGVFLSVVTALILCEIFARAVLYDPPLETNVGTPRQGLTSEAIGDWVPNQRAIWENGRLEYPFFVHINGAGFRNLEELNPTAFRILVLGDSQTFGLFVSSHDILTNVAEKRLNARLKSTVQLLNNGIPGSTISDHLAYLVEKGDRLSPKMVLLMVNPNDIGDLRRDDTSVGSLRSSWMASRDNLALQEIRWFLRHYSGLYIAARNIKELFVLNRHKQEVRELHLKNRRGTASSRAIMRKSPAETDQTKYEQYLIEAIATVRSLGARPVLAFLSAPWDGDTFVLRTILERVSMKREVPFLDLTPAFEEGQRDQATWHRDPSVDPEYEGDGHYNRFGNLLVGNYLADLLAPLINDAVKH